MASYVFPFTGSHPVSETFAQGDPGTDWSMPTGTPILAIADGTVKTVGSPPNAYGPGYIEIDHGNGIVSFYGHNSQALVTVGQQVKQGQQIALSGGAAGSGQGNSTGPHLELGIIINGKHVDPQAFLASQGAGFASGITATNADFSLNPFDWVSSLLKKIIQPIIEFAIQAGMIIGGGILMAIGVIILAQQSDTAKGLVNGAASIGLSVVK